MNQSQPALFEEVQPDIDLAIYEKVIVFFSGGKDSLACLLWLLEAGVPREKIELWHHEIDGREGSTLMDWPVTPDYCAKIAAALELPIYFSWKQGGFEREMLRENALTAPSSFETPEGTLEAGGKVGRLNTRRRFPQVAADLSVRWCSAYLKIDVACTALRNDQRFRNVRTLVVSGERGEESCSRANYAAFETHRADLRAGQKFSRHIDQLRPVHKWLEEKVWEIIERWGLNPHPAYHLGFGRVSCMKCIFGSKNQWATVRKLDPEGFSVVSGYEKEFGCTIQRSQSVEELADSGVPYPSARGRWAKMAMSRSFDAPVIIKNWTLPAGAFGESTGPT